MKQSSNAVQPQEFGSLGGLTFENPETLLSNPCRHEKDDCCRTHCHQDGCPYSRRYRRGWRPRGHWTTNGRCGRGSEGRRSHCSCCSGRGCRRCQGASPRRSRSSPRRGWRM
ncbi:uncharacterized protein LOC142558412 [Dermacentor variabilis]|uniref:uncharacterized protein LOC142558412 n=1 Tax=Dermacentor variabilis TaxID=34621 RepID=UPI003F5BA354